MKKPEKDEYIYLDLPLDQKKSYIITKWKADSLSIFERETFDDFCERLMSHASAACAVNRHLARYLLLNTFSMEYRETMGFAVPKVLLNDGTEELLYQKMSRRQGPVAILSPKGKEEK